MTELLDTAQIRSREILLNAALRVYGLPGHLRTCETCDELRRDCMCGVCLGCRGDGCEQCHHTGDA